LYRGTSQRCALNQALEPVRKCVASTTCELLLQVQPHQDILVMIAKAAAENIDASWMGSVVVDANP
jgi:hypothetical protein